MCAAVCALDKPLKLRLTVIWFSPALSATVPSPVAVELFVGTSCAALSRATKRRSAGAVVSSSLMVSVAVEGAPSVPSEGFESVRLMVSLPST